MTTIIVKIEVKEDIEDQFKLLVEKVVTMAKSLENDYNSETKKVLDVVVEQH